MVAILNFGVEERPSFGSRVGQAGFFWYADICVSFCALNAHIMPPHKPNICTKLICVANITNHQLPPARCAGDNPGTDCAAEETHVTNTGSVAPGVLCGIFF